MNGTTGQRGGATATRRLPVQGTARAEESVERTIRAAEERSIQTALGQALRSGRISATVLA